MTNQEFTIKKGDTKPALEAQLLDENEDPRDLSTNVDGVRFHMKNVSTQDVAVDASALILDAADGKVAYEWSDGDTDTEGRHQGEFEVNYSDDTDETFPSNGYIEIYVNEDIA